MTLSETSRDCHSRTPKPAILAWQHKTQAVWALLQRYAYDDDFGSALEALYWPHRTGLQRLVYREHWWTPYILDQLAALPVSDDDAKPLIVAASAVRRFAARWGLDRFRQEQGLEALRAWFLLRLDPVSGKRITAHDFCTGVGSGGTLPQVGAVTERHLHNVSSPSGDEFVVVDETRRPIVEAPTPDTWYADRESPGDAYNRILTTWSEHLRNELDQLRDEYVASGFEFHDTRPEARSHMDWLYERLAYRAHPADIGQRANRAEGSVRNETRDLAKWLEIELPRARKRTI